MEVCLGKLLQQVCERGTILRSGKVGRRTQKDVGFNIKLKGSISQSENCYLHTGPDHKGLVEGRELLLSVANSIKVEDRLDVLSYTSYPDDLMAALRVLDSKELATILPFAYLKLSNDDWAEFWDIWVANPKELQTVSSLLSKSLFALIQDRCPETLLFSLIDITEPTVNLIWRLITEKYLEASYVNRLRVLDCLASHPDLLLGLTEKNLLNKNAISNINRQLRDEGVELDVDSFEIDLGLKNLDGDALFQLISNHHSAFDSQNWAEVWDAIVSNLLSLAHYEQKIPPLAWQSLIENQPLKYLSRFIDEAEPSDLKLMAYLQTLYLQDNEENKALVNAYIDTQEQLKLKLIAKTMSGTKLPEELGLVPDHLEASGFIAILPYLPKSLEDPAWALIWQYWKEKPKSLIDAVKKGVSEPIWNNISKVCPEDLWIDNLDFLELTPQQIWSYISRRSAKIPATDIKSLVDYINARKELLDYFSSMDLQPEELPKALDFFLPDEVIFWSFIVDFWSAADSDVQAIVRRKLNDTDYIQAGFLLYLVDIGTEQREYPLLQLSKDVDILIGNLFDKHALKQTVIKETIFMDCPVRLGFSACEASIAPNKNKGKESEYGELQPDYNYWCRRMPCQAAECLVKHESRDEKQLREELLGLRFLSGFNPEEFSLGGHFYKLVSRFWGYDKSQLHDQSNASFLRPLAAINRWNELVERLICRCCNGTLRISEHSPNSINKMAYAVTYWHCANKDCPEYAHSVKLSHCQGNRCDKIIDSREDRQSCTPWEVRSYKKMYLCTKCGSCCPKHAKSGGYVLCPCCGRDNAYKVPPDRSGRMNCTYCNHSVTLPWDKREEVQYRFSKNDISQATNDNSEAGSTCFLLPRQFLPEAGEGFLSLNFRDDKPRLYVYDLFACLKNGHIKNLAKYSKIYDIRTIEKLHYLGKFHKRYSNGDKQVFGLIKHLRNITSQSELDELAWKVSEYISKLLDETISNGVIKHYEEIELPFTLSLYSLLGTGFSIDHHTLSDKVAELELARNIAVESLREKGIDTPTRESLKMWLPYSDSGVDTTMILNRIDHIDFKTIRNIDPVFEAFYRVEKFERMGSSIKSVFDLNGPILPDYQIVGTNTLRCTSQRPNLLGFPKQLRPVVQASPERCIIECDYAQMEVGVVAALSADPLLIDHFNNGDVYSSVAEDLGIDRDRAKLVFLGILYGVGKKTLQLWLEKDKAGVEHLLNQLFQRYKGLASYQERLVQHGEHLGYVEAVTGLRRSVNKQSVVSDALAVWQRNWFKNYPVQASAAIVFKRAVIEVAENVQLHEFKLIAPLYDSLVFEVPLDKKSYYTGLVCSAMKRAMTFYFPQLQPNVSINDYDITCWNGGEGVENINKSMDRNNILSK